MSIQNKIRYFVVVMFFFLMVASRLGYAGISNVQGWNYKPVYFPPQQEGTADGIDVDGEIGHPLSVANPTANCSSSEGWYGQEEIISGTLPPGISMDDHGYISGIPTERGHWIVTLKDSLECGGQSYFGFTQQIRFHITGTGKVIE